MDNILVGIESWIKDILIPVVAFIAAYYGAKRALTAPHRESLYEKQLDAASEIMLVVYAAGKVDGATQLRKGLEDLSLLETRWSVYLPKGVLSAITEVKGVIVSRLILAQSDPPNDFIPPSREKTSWEFLKAQVSVAVELREMIGVEPLTVETKKMFEELLSRQNEQRNK